MLDIPTNIFLYSLLKERAFYSLSLILLSFFSTVCNIVATILLIPILSSSIEKTSYSEIIFIGQIDRSIEGIEIEYRLAILITALFMLILLKNIANYLSAIVGFKQTKDLVNRLKTKAIATHLETELAFGDRYRTEEILLQLNREIERTALAARSTQKLVILALTIAMMTLVSIAISWQLTLASLIALALIITANNWLLARASKTRIASLTATQASSRQIANLLEGVRFLKTVANKAEASKAIAKSLKSSDQLQLSTRLISAIIEPLTEIGGAILVLTLVVVSNYLYGDSIPTIAPLLLVYLAIWLRLLPFLSQFNLARLQYINTRSSVEVVANFLKRENRLTNAGEKELFSKLNTGIQFKAVTLTDHRRGQNLLERVHLWIAPRKTIALIGLPETRSSLIADLLYRFYEPTAGTILLNERELSVYDLSSLRKAIAVVSQETFLFDNTLAYNIAYGVENVQRADPIAAAKKAGLFPLIEQLEAGLDTKVGRDFPLSALQKLQISLARAFLRHPEIIIFERPLDKLDPHSPEFAAIHQTIQLLSRDCTTIIITQQLELAQAADSIIIFNRGKIAETGSHQQLLEQGHIYPGLYSRQFKIQQQSRQLRLAQKIARKLAQRNDYLAPEIRTNFNTLLTSLEILNQGWFDRDSQEETILDESFESAQNILASLRAYRRSIGRDLED